MSTEECLDFESLEESVEYTVKTMQYIYGPEGYFYRITVSSEASTHYMSVFDGSQETAIFDKLEKYRKLEHNKEFTFTKQSIEIGKDWIRLCILVAEDNDVVRLV